MKAGAVTAGCAMSGRSCATRLPTCTTPRPARASAALRPCGGCAGTRPVGPSSSCPPAWPGTPAGPRTRTRTTPTFCWLPAEHRAAHEWEMRSDLEFTRTANGVSELGKYRLRAVPSAAGPQLRIFPPAAT